MKAYAMDTSKPIGSRVDMLTAIAYVQSEKGARAMVDIAKNAVGAEVTTSSLVYRESG